MNAEETISKPFATGMRRLCILSVLVLTGALGGAGYWAVSAAVGAAVISEGQVVLEGNTRQIQHTDGGYISELLVTEGDYVAAGQTLVRLDPTRARATLSAVSDQLNAVIAIEGRLVAESVDRAEYMIAEEDITHAQPGEKFDRLLHAQQLLLNSRRISVQGRMKQLEEQKVQVQEGINALEAQLQAATTERDILEDEQARQQILAKRGLVTSSQIAALQSQSAQLDARVATLMSEVSQSRLLLGEIDLQALQLRDDTRRDVLEELASVRREKARLIQEKIAAEHQLARLTIRTSQSGIVHDLQVSGLDEVIRPGQTLMTIVPQDDDFVIEARVSPRDIDQVYVGQSASLNFTSFNMRTTPSIDAAVLRLSPDVAIDEASGQPFYRASIAIKPDQVDRLGSSSIVPGMPVTAFLRTSERTVADYIWQPIADHLERAFREE